MDKNAYCILRCKVAKRMHKFIFNFIKITVLKTLLIIRHAKSNQSFLGNDFERPLNERGQKDAPEMAKRLNDKNILIDAFISSPAKRASQTAQLFSNILPSTNKTIIYNELLYHAPSDIFFKVIKNLPDVFNTVAIFAHNPGITHFVNDLQLGVAIDNMPTCGVFVFTINNENWFSFATSSKAFSFFDYPKNIV
jgi:phosphohistidine phosphatase